MIYQDEKHLNRYGNEKRQELSCIPQQLQDGIFSKYAVEGTYNPRDNVSKLL